MKLINIGGRRPDTIVCSRRPAEVVISINEGGLRHSS